MARNTFTLLERTAEDEAAGLHPVQLRGGPIVRLTGRQLEIINMSMEEKMRVPRDEQMALGRILMDASAQNIDQILRDKDENPPDVPELVAEP